MSKKVKKNKFSQKNYRSRDLADRLPGAKLFDYAKSLIDSRRVVHNSWMDLRPGYRYERDKPMRVIRGRRVTKDTRKLAADILRDSYIASEQERIARESLIREVCRDRKKKRSILFALFRKKPGKGGIKVKKEDRDYNMFSEIHCD